MVSNDLSKTRRMELILRQIDSLPTLPVIATRLLALTADDEAETREVIELVSADPALTAKVLSLCSSADKGLRHDTLTIDRAVLLLGFSAIRNAVLSVKVFETFAGPSAEMAAAGGEAASGEDTFDRAAFWSHSLAVAVLAEQIAAGHPGDKRFDPSEAFVCGLLHDIGKLALHHVLPKSFSRVVELADLNQGNIAEFERRIVGIDHHTAGKRLAEQWHLPHRLQDAIWLHGSCPVSMPKLEHRHLITLVSLADLIARRQHVGYSGNHVLTQSVEELTAQLDLRPEVVQSATENLYEQLEARCNALGLKNHPSQAMFIESMQHANEALGRLNQTLERRGRTATGQKRVLEAVSAFHAAASPAQTVQDVLDSVVDSARLLFGAGFYAMLYPNKDTRSGQATWLISQYAADARPIRSEYVDAPPHAPNLSQLDASESTGVNLIGLLPWIADYLLEADDMRQVKLLALPCGWGTAAILLHDREELASFGHLGAMTHTWGAAIAAAAQHEGARRLGEQLAEANSALAEAQDRLLRQESMARLGEMAAGAAHEMNNPLAVISGRSQLLSMTLDPGSDAQREAQSIFREAHRLSDLISCLHMFADPPQPERKTTDLAALLNDTIRKVNVSQRRRDGGPDISLKLKDQPPPVAVDGRKIQRAVTELLLNAVQANPKSGVQVVAQLEPGGEAVVVQVIDDGDGMDSHTLAHAMDPFFSNKPAGRRVGMGLPRAQQLIQSHGGDLGLRSTKGERTVATFSLPLDSRRQDADTTHTGAPETAAVTTGNL